MLQPQQVALMVLLPGEVHRSRAYGCRLRELAATMREMLKIEAAKLLNLGVADLSTEIWVIIQGGGQSMTYGEVVGQVSEWNIPKTPPLKEMGSYKFIGKPIPRVDLLEKVEGAPIFGMDVRYARNALWFGRALNVRSVQNF